MCFVQNQYINFFVLIEFFSYFSKGTYSKWFKVSAIEVRGWEGQFNDYACKVLAKGAYKQFPDLPVAHKNEIDIVVGLSHHDHVVGLFDHFDDAKHIYLIFSYCSRGSLFDLLEKANWQMADSIVRVYRRHILSGLEFIHRYRIIHVDLKLQNVFVNHQGLARIGDFGMSLRFDGHLANANGEMNCPNPGTIIYQAYESVVRRVVSFRTDVLAFAVLAYIMKVGRAPFWSTTRKGILDEIRDIHYL